MSSLNFRVKQFSTGVVALTEQENDGIIAFPLATVCSEEVSHRDKDYY